MRKRNICFYFKINNQLVEKLCNCPCFASLFSYLFIYFFGKKKTFSCLSNEHRNGKQTSNTATSRHRETLRRVSRQNKTEEYSNWEREIRWNDNILMAFYHRISPGNFVGALWWLFRTICLSLCLHEYLRYWGVCVSTFKLPGGIESTHTHTVHLLNVWARHTAQKQNMQKATYTLEIWRTGEPNIQQQWRRRSFFFPSAVQQLP